MQCKCVKYSEIGSEIQQHLKKRMLIPILGSGFTRNCESYAGKVPSGEDYKKYMIGEILKERKYDDTQKKKYENKQFSEISTIYHKVISKEEQRKYLRNNFTKVKLNGEKKKFLEIDWPYIYTLNADDAIERIFPPILSSLNLLILLAWLIDYVDKLYEEMKDVKKRAKGIIEIDWK